MKIALFFLFACEQKESDTSTTDTAAETSQTADEPSQPVDEPSEPADETSSEPVGDAAAGEQIVNTRCMGCHNGNPAIGNASNMTDEELINLFANGKGSMPPVSMTDQEALDVVAYLRQEYGGQ